MTLFSDYLPESKAPVSVMILYSKAGICSCGFQGYKKIVLIGFPEQIPEHVTSAEIKQFLQHYQSGVIFCNNPQCPNSASKQSD